MRRANEELRVEAKKAGVPLWKIADYIGISEPTLTRKLRKELTPEEKQRLRTVINAINAKEVGETNG